MSDTTTSLLAKFFRSDNRRRYIHDDPAKGLECNSVSRTIRVSRHIYEFDMARSPHVWKSFDERVNIHAEAGKINSMRIYLDKSRYKMHNRSR